ncbi:Zn-dependent protease [Psychromonas sp. psych-6C06]|uniref:M48 family metallopeptidase n=1 Tax=Psychromonas sp. psych-6C06 TaxID=2058089 RepID=UPI000C330ACA|nr:M48 family metallopeptidase [Psychromonas sp. psych-6C06]PKF63425.1 Zn-dependent protease [Psychromonas sp. psych-6C06]
MRFSKTLCLASVVTSSLLLSACSSSPTGRGQLLLFSGAEMSEMGAQSFEQMKQQESINLDPKINNYVQCVSNAMTRLLGPQPHFKNWEVVVFDSDQVNAFALPGGKIGVYTGLLKVAVNQDQLAAVIGHEIAHVMADHSNERLSRSQITDAGLAISSVAMEGSEYQSMTMAGLGLGVQYGVMMPYGRAQESESDIVGLRLMTEAGFDPKQSVELWKNMAKASGGQQPPELLSTHPSHSTRISDLQSEISRLPKSSAKRQHCQA